MGSIIDAIADDVELYKYLCSHYGEEFVEKRMHTDYYKLLKIMYKDRVEPHSSVSAEKLKTWAQTAGACGIKC